jgi:general secretion pathway protein G
MRTSQKLRTNNAAKRLRQHAFTLVELLLVLSILALLAGLVLPKLVGTKKTAEIKTTITQLDSFKTALNMFEVDNGHFPKTLNDLIIKPRDASADWHKYLDNDAVPLDPWQHAYIYQSPGRHNPDSYDLSSAGPDGQAGNDDDIKNWTAK